jgi:DNA-binding response OmpR family regulator
VLVIDPDDDVAPMVRVLLEKEPVDVLSAASMSEGLKVAGLVPVILTILDLPRDDAEECCRIIRGTGVSAIIVLTPDLWPIGQEEDARKLKADEYLRKNSPPHVMRARLLRFLVTDPRLRSTYSETSIGAVAWRPKTKELVISGVSHRLTRLKAWLVALLMEEPGAFVSARDVFLRSRGGWPRCESAAVKQCVHELRVELGAHAGLVETARGVGYRINVQYALALPGPGQGPATSRSP